MPFLLYVQHYCYCIVSLSYFPSYITLYTCIHHHCSCHCCCSVQQYCDCIVSLSYLPSYITLYTCIHHHCSCHWCCYVQQYCYYIVSLSYLPSYRGLLLYIRVLITLRWILFYCPFSQLINLPDVLPLVNVTDNCETERGPERSCRTNKQGS